MNSAVLRPRNIGNTKPISAQDRLPYKMVVRADEIKQGVLGGTRKQEAK